MIDQTNPEDLRCPQCGCSAGWPLLGAIWAGPDDDGIEATVRTCGSCRAELVFYRKTVTTYSVHRTSSRKVGE